MSNEKSRNNHFAGSLYVIAAFTAWGFLPLYWHGLSRVAAAEILAHRIIWSFVFVFILLIAFRRWKQFTRVLSSRSGMLTVLLSSILISLNWYTYIWAINNNHVVETSLGYYITPLFNVLLGVLILRERLNAWQVVSLLLACIGVAIQAVQYGKIPWIALSLTLTFGLYGLVKKLTTLDSITGLAFETFLALPVAAAYILLKQSRHTGAFGTSFLTTILLIFCGVVTALPLLWFAKGAKMVPMSTTGFAQYLSPSITLVLGIFVFREPFTKAEIASFAFIWCALALYSVAQTNMKRFLPGAGRRNSEHCKSNAQRQR